MSIFSYSKLLYFLDLTKFLKTSKQSDETKQLNEFKQKLRGRSNIISESIKDVVFEHYKHFMDASKEVSGLFYKKISS